MPRSFDISADYEGSVERVFQTFLEEAYWQARLTASAVDEATLESIHVGGASGNDGTIKVITLQVVHRDKLPAIITQFHRGDLRVRREETWGPVTDGSATASVVGTILDAPVSLSGTASLSPIQTNGSRLDCRVTIQVRIPIIGGKLEKFIGAQLTELVQLEQQFTSEWIGDRA